MAGRYGLQIRRAAPADGPGVADLLTTAGLSVEAKQVSDRLEALERQPGVTLLALDWGPPIGVIVVQWRRSLFEDAPIGLVDLLYVRPEDRRRGLGRLMVKAAAQAARSAGCGRLEMIATSQHTGLADFSLAAGFLELDGRRYGRSLRKRS